MSQGKDPETAGVVAFWSDKWNAAQQNYPVREQGLLALVKTLKGFRGVLQWNTINRPNRPHGPRVFHEQRNLSPRQHWWIDVLGQFEFEIRNILGESNGFADALSRIYSDQPRGIIRAESEYINEGDDTETTKSVGVNPVYVEVYLLSLMNVVTRRSSRLANGPAPRYKEARDRRTKRERGRGQFARGNGNSRDTQGTGTRSHRSGLSRTSNSRTQAGRYPTPRGIE